MMAAGITSLSPDSTINSIAQSEGDPHIQDIYGHHIILNNDIKKCLLYYDKKS